MVQTLAADGELQRPVRREPTHDGLRASEAKGRKGGLRSRPWSSGPSAQQLVGHGGRRGWGFRRR
ncbi:hypothetical protein ABZ621_34005 [Streptomyces sp. NPDC007863]|uniref:hypothetical protein n=1 Tax=Streptomyces sp. NPDC007863 TaxID=3154894 RepID=UPI0033FF192B